MWGICQNEDLKSAVVVGLPHNSLKNLPHWGYFWLTVQTGISYLDLVFVSHSFPLRMSEAAPRSMNSMDSILEDQKLKRTQPDWQNVSQFTMCVPNAWRSFSAARHPNQNGLAFLQELDEVRMTLIDWQRGNFHCELIQHPEIS